MPAEAARILVVDDNQDVLVAARLLLKQQGYQVRTETDPQAIPSALKQESPAVVLLDMNFTQEATSGREGFYWLQQIRDLDPTAVVLLITAYGDVEMAVRAVKEGAADFVLKPWQNEKLLATVSAAVELHRSRRETHHLRSRPAAAVRRPRPALRRPHRRGPGLTGSLSDNGQGGRHRRQRPHPRRRTARARN